MQKIHDKLIELDDSSRRNNSRIEGIEETKKRPREMQRKCKENVQALIQENLEWK